MVAFERTDSATLALSGGVDVEQTARAAKIPDPAISVVIPCYNGVDTLPDTLRSLRRQNFRRWEAIVVDDGSTDGAAALAERWARRDPRIRVIRTEHGGVAAASNLGVAAARAPWIGFLDCDDWLARDAYQRLLRLADQQPTAGVVMGGACAVLPDGRRRRFPPRDLGDAFRALCQDGHIAIHSALVQRELILGVGRFDPTLATHEDWDLWLRVARTGTRFAQTPAMIAFYRMRPDSLSRQVWPVAVDGLKVMERAYAPDPRVARPHPAHAAGGPREDLLMHRFYFGLWSAARDIAAGGDGQAIVDLVLEDQGREFDARDLGGLMASGMAGLAACAPHDLAPRWDAFEPRLRALLDRACPRAEQARRKALTLGVIKAALNAGKRGEADVLDLNRPRRPTILSEDPAAILQLRRGRRTLGAVALAALGPMTPATFARMTAAQAARLARQPAARALAPWSSWAFWRAAGVNFLGAVSAALLKAPPGLTRDLVRARLRTAASAGVQADVVSRLKGMDWGEGEEDVHAARLDALAAEAGLARLDRPRPWARSAATGPALGVSVPILMYHRIASEGGLARYRVAPDLFAEQMALLRAAGFRTLTPEALAEGLARGRPFAGRPVMLTFDDGYDDFHDQAWPILAAHGFTATVFAVAGKLGQSADWDEEYGPPASLMTGERLRALADQGVAIGSHAFSHRRLTLLGMEDLYREALRSAATLEQALGRRKRWRSRGCSRRCPPPVRPADRGRRTDSRT